MSRTFGSLAAALLALAGSLGVALWYHRNSLGVFDQLLGDRLLGVGQTAAFFLRSAPPEAALLKELKEVNSLDAVYLVDSKLIVRSDAGGLPGRRVDLLRVDLPRLRRALAGEASVAEGFQMGSLKVRAGYFPLGGPQGSVLVLEAGESFQRASTALQRALGVSVALAVCALALSVLVGRWLAGERDRRQLAEKAARADTLFRVAAMAAHEIRNPLGVIRGTVELLTERMGPRLTERDRASFADVLGEVERLKGLTQDLLDLTSDRPLSLTVVELGLVLEDAARALEVERPGIRVALQASGTLLVRADAARIRQVLTNLLSNAADALGQGEVQVRAVTSRGKVRVEVEDGGPGVPPEVQARLFEPFVSGKAHGTGLGLALSRRLAESFDGTLRLEQTGVRTVFELELPEAKGSELSQEVLPDGARAGRR